MTKRNSGSDFAAALARARGQEPPPPPPRKAKAKKPETSERVARIKPVGAARASVQSGPKPKANGHRRPAAPPDGETQISVNADRFRIASMSCSTEEARYYLAGVYVEPHNEGGVNLVSTDGHTLVHVYDPDGRCDRAAIIRLNKDMLRACKLDKDDRMLSTPKRTLNVDLKTGQAQVLNAYLQPVAVQVKVEVDGTFPDYRRVVPSNLGAKRVAAGFNGHLIERMCAIGSELSKANGHGGLQLAIHSADLGSPALVLWDNIDHAYGVMMPYRVAEATSSGTYPAFALKNAYPDYAKLAEAPPEAAETTPAAEAAPQEAA